MRPVAPDLHETEEGPSTVPDGRKRDLVLEQASVPPPVAEHSAPRLATADRFVHRQVGFLRQVAAPKHARDSPADKLGGGVARHALEGRVHILDDSARVGQDDEVGRILDGGREARALEFGPLARGDVDDEGNGRRAIRERRARQVHEDREPGPVLPQAFGFVGTRNGEAFGTTADVLGDGGARLRSEELERTDSPQLLQAREAEHVQVGRVGVRDIRATCDVDRDRRRLEHQPEAVLTLPDGSLGASQRGDVTGDDHIALDRAVRGESRRDPDLDAADHPIGETPVCLAQPRLPLSGNCGERRDRGGIEDRRRDLEHALPHELGMGQAQVLRESRVGVRDPQPSIGNEDAVGRLLDHDAEALALPTHPLDLGDVSHGEHEPITHPGSAQVKHLVERSAGRIAVNIVERSRDRTGRPFRRPP